MAEEEKEKEKNEKKNSGWIRKGLHYGCLSFKLMRRLSTLR